MSQDKHAEIEFFNQFAQNNDYNVFTDASNTRIVSYCLELADLPDQANVVDLGCGSGIFTSLFQQQSGAALCGLDISHGLTKLGRQLYPQITFITGDVETLPFATSSLDGIILSGLIHHLPDPSKLANEVYRVLKPGRTFVGFDPNRRNPFMYLYRDRSSPFYSNKGVTANERPILAEKTARIFEQAGFTVMSHYLSGLHYRYVASPTASAFLPVYNALDSILFALPFMRRHRAFVFTRGMK
jgi:ubiquinone/menaquinone biosynthesis C-methylase UbiE